MSTSDPLKAATTPLSGDPADATATLEAVVRDFGLPDVGEIARLANDLFREATSLPSAAPAVPSAASLGIPQDVTGLTLSPIPGANTPIPAPALPTQLPAVPNQAMPIATTTSVRPGLSSASSAVASAPTSVPGLIAHPPVSTPVRPTTGFSFLDDARAIFSDAASAVDAVTPAPVTTQFGVPFEGDLRDFASLGKAAEASSPPNVPTGLAHPTTQTLPGIPTSTATVDPTRALTEDVRALTYIDVVPSVVPFGSELGAVPTTSISSGLFDVNAIRRDFPILAERVNGRPLIWFDNAATTQKPQSVIDRISYFYEHENSNIHRAAHTLAARSTDAYEGAREKVRRFLNASTKDEIIFVRGATEGINLIAQTYGKRFVQKDDEVVVTHLEHHANIVPWQMLCAEKGARLRVVPVDDSGQVILEEFERLLGGRTKIVSIAHVSNALGTVTPVEEMTKIAHRHGAKVVLDGAQAVSHLRVDVQQYDCDFYVFSGHKVFAPTGIGVVYGKHSVLEQLPPYQGGGNMISDVTFEKTQYHGPPMRFEAGTGSIADAVGLGAAIDYVERVGMHNISRYEHDLLVYGTERLLTIPGLRLIGTAKEKASVMSFVLDGFTTEQVGQGLSKQGIAVRSGHHCAQPILRRFGQESTVRPSLAFYNTCEEIDQLIAAIWNIKNGNVPSVV